ncbi:hypothetical protein SAMD00079811_54260 [Scytonema sp. HK-05]|nr:hypothetical protein SAMD00079811_54260 [Scytonema sp. HK-05]
MIGFLAAALILLDFGQQMMLLRNAVVNMGVDLLAD